MGDLVCIMPSFRRNSQYTSKVVQITSSCRKYANQYRSMILQLISLLINIRLQKQMLPCASVVHDLQKNVYFRIDKKTGLEAQSHKNGELIKFFKVDVTGNDYKIRKRIERPSLKAKKTVNYSNKAIRMESISPKNPNPPVTLEKELPLLIVSRLKSQQSDSNFLTNFQTIADKPLKKDYTHMGNLLKHYEKLSQRKIFQNHSRIGKDTGTLLNLKHDLSKGFRETKNIVYQPFASIDRSYRKSIKTINENPVPREDWKQKIIREKQRFLEFHPHFTEQQNTRLLKQQMDRKINIKKLQSLFLDQSSKATCRIYQ